MSVLNVSSSSAPVAEEPFEGHYPNLRAAAAVVMAIFMVPYIFIVSNMTTLIIWREPELTVKGQTVLSMAAPDIGGWAGLVYFGAMVLVAFSLVFGGKRTGLIGPILISLFALATIAAMVLNSIPAA